MNDKRTKPAEELQVVSAISSRALSGAGMAKRIVCDGKKCTKCRDLIMRTYQEWRENGESDRDAILSSVDILGLHHPGHARYDYFRCVARLLSNKR